MTHLEKSLPPEPEFFIPKEVQDRLEKKPLIEMEETKVDIQKEERVVSVDIVKSGALNEVQMFELIQRQCVPFIKSGLFKDMDISKAVTISLMGKALGIEPIIALRCISVINGKAVLESALMKALVHKKLPHAIFNFKESTTEKCVVEASRGKDSPPHTYSFTLEDAQRAGLLNKDNWKKYPEDMLRNRCISRVCRAEFSDCFMGSVYTEEELKE